MKRSIMAFLSSGAGLFVMMAGFHHNNWPVVWVGCLVLGVGLGLLAAYFDDKFKTL